MIRLSESAKMAFVEESPHAHVDPGEIEWGGRVLKASYLWQRGRI